MPDYEFDLEFVRNRIYHSEGVLPYPVTDHETGEVSYPYIYKATLKDELNNYQFYLKNDPDGLAKFLPKVLAYSEIDSEDIFRGKYHWDVGPKARNWMMLLENLGADMTYHSYMDLKLGTTHGKQSRFMKDAQYYIDKAKMVNSYDKGFYLFDLQVKDQETGEVVRQELKNYELDDKREFQLFFSNKDGHLNLELLKSALKTVEEMIEYFLTTKLELELRCLSLLFIIDHKNSKLKTNFVDVSYVEKILEDADLFPLNYKDDNGILKDGGLIMGLKNIKTILQQVLDDHE